MTAHAQQITYEDLYARWERGNWSATEIDFSADREQWLELSEHERRAALWNYSMFFHGEDVVATDLAPFIDAAPREEQRYFLATQQVDEARHAVFFKRFMQEVAGAGTGSIRSSLEATRPQLTWGFVKTFEMLDEITGRLRRDRSRVALARAVFMYHFIVEATLAQPGQHFIESYLVDRDLLPGFRAGMRNVALDEQRHIAFGVRLLHDLREEEPVRVPEAITGVIRDVMQYSVALFVPPNWDRSYTECFGFTLEEIYEEGARSLEQKLRSAGMPFESLPGPIAFPYDLPPRERAERRLLMAQSGIVGAGGEPARRDPETLEMLFDMVRRSVDHRRAPGRPVVLQWDFSDAQPWHVRVDNGSSAAAPGRAPDPDVTLRMGYQDWVDVVGGRADPLRLMARGRLRPKGSLRSLLLFGRLFPR